MDVPTDPRAWAEATFALAHLGDSRRTQRLVESAARIAAHPSSSFPQIFDWDALRGFYRLCNRPEATLQAIQQPHWQQTRQASAQHPLVLILHDSTVLDFTTHAALQGIGPVGDHRGRGFLQHNSLAVLPSNRRILGLTYQQLWVRPDAANPAPAHALGQDESVVWQRGIQAPGPPPEGCCWVDVGDRGSDDYQAMRAAREVEHHFLLRLTQNRRVFTCVEQDQSAYLLDYARTLPSQGSDTVAIPGRGGRPPRTAQVQLAGAPIWVPAPAGTPQRRSQPVLAAWVIRVWEPEPPPGVEALEWLLVCSLPTTTLEELKERRDWYGCRWLIEVFHQVEKSGCGEEERRFETAGAQEACLALLAVVAVRVLQLRNALEWEASEAAEAVATAAEITLVRQLVRHRGRRFTVRDFVRGVAQLGGFLGRTGDGEPGVRTLWRGYQRLQDMLLGCELQHDAASRKNVGKR
jgi:hypothetical protein